MKKQLFAVIAASMLLTSCSFNESVVKTTETYTRQDCIDFHNRKLTYNLGAVANQLTGGYASGVLNLVSFGVLGETTKELYNQRNEFCKDVIAGMEKDNLITYSNGQIILRVQ